MLLYTYQLGQTVISVSAVTNLGGIVCGFAMARLGLPIPAAVILTLLAGAICGLLKAGIVVKLALPPFIMTLGLQYVINGFVLVSTNGLPITGFSDSFKFLGQGKIFGVYWTVVLAAIEGIIIHVMLNRTKFGRQICAVGGNQETAKLAGIDVEKTRTLVNVLLNELRNTGISCIYISHKLEEIYKLCDHVLVLRDGHAISCHDVADVVEATLIEEMVGRKVENLYPKSPHVDESVEVLRVEHLSVPHPNMPGRYIVEDISFNLKKGEILGIGGLVGAGRSECLGAVFGQYTKNVKKDVYVYGEKVDINNPKDAIAHGIEFVTEERKRNGIIWMLSIRENISLASLNKISKGLFIDHKKEVEEVLSLSGKLRIKARNIDTKLIQLSGGNQQKVILAKWLLNNPRILFMDEPTKGIDVGTKADFYKLMSNLTEQGVSIILDSQKFLHLKKPANLLKYQVFPACLE